MIFYDAPTRAQIEFVLTYTIIMTYTQYGFIRNGVKLSLVTIPYKTFWVFLVVTFLNPKTMFLNFEKKMLKLMKIQKNSENFRKTHEKRAKFSLCVP